MNLATKAEASLEKYRTKVELTLEDIFKEEIKSAADIGLDAVDSILNISRFTLRKGKRIRPVLIIHGYKCVGGEDEDEILKAACSIELFHNGILMHDDIADQDAVRRKGPTMHKIYEHFVRSEYDAKDSEHFGESLATNDGDITMIFLAQSTLLNSNFSSDYKIKAMKRYCNLVRSVACGQKRDILSIIREDISEKYVLDVHRLKTASYTIEGPLHIGAILGGAKDEELEALTEYGIPVGIAFQLKDDDKGLFSEKDLRKEKNDLNEGKKTLLIVKALEFGDKKQRETIKKYLGRKDLADEQIKEVQDIVESTGSREYSTNLMSKLVEEGKRVVKDCSFKQESKDFFIGLADYTIKREW